MPAEESQLPPPPKKQGLLNFGRAEQPQALDMSGISADINTLSRRLRMLEEGMANLRRFFQVSEDSLISKGKHYSSEFKTINSDIGEIRKEMQEAKDKLLLVIRELQTVARKEDVKVLERYINLWNPIKFVSQNEIEGIINEVLDARKKSKKENKKGEN